MENAVLKKFREGRPSLGTFTAVGNPLAVESLRYTGLDYVIVDTEHTPAGIESAAAQIAAAQGAGLTALARANEISRTAVLRLLDVGAQGVVVPCVETVEEVRELVQYAKYTPLGNRGFCPTRDGGWGHASHAASIPAYATYYIQTMAAQGVISGYADGTFQPGANITRGQMAKILYNLL